MKNKNYVWEFTNQRKLNKKEFLRYFEKKVFATIRKYKMFGDGKSRKIFLKKCSGLNFNVLKYVLGKKFDVEVVAGSKGFSCYDLSDVAEMIFLDILKGKFNNAKFRLENLKAPLCRLLDREVELYAQLVGIKGNLRKKDVGIEKFFGKFKSKNPDLEQNVVKAFEPLF